MDVFWSFLGSTMSFVITIVRWSMPSMCTSANASRFLRGKTIDFSMRWHPTFTILELSQTPLKEVFDLSWSLSVRLRHFSVHYPIEYIFIKRRTSLSQHSRSINRWFLVRIESLSIRMDDSLRMVLYQRSRSLVKFWHVTRAVSVEIRQGIKRFKFQKIKATHIESVVDRDAARCCKWRK